MEKQRSSAHIRAQISGKKRDGNVCQICGSSDHVEGHHIIDHAFGGAATADNIIALCRKHHRDVHNGLINIFKI